MITFLEDWEQEFNFHCTATIVRHYKDRDRYWSMSRAEPDLLEADTRDALLEQMAIYLNRCKTDPNNEGEYESVEFSTIYQSIAYEDFDMKEIDKTFARSTFLFEKKKKAEEAAKKIEDAKLALEAKKKIETEAKEKEILAILLAKYGKT